MKHHRATRGDIRRLLLTDIISELHTRSRGKYGRRRIRAALAIERDLIVNMRLIVKIMRDLQIVGLPHQKKGKRNLVNVATYEDRVNRDFQAVETNSLWLTDITEHPTREGKIYCCAVLDLFSRKIVGWAIDRHCETTLVNDALSMAASSRTTSPSTIIHSDHGSQFTSWRFSENVRRFNLLGSMGTIGNCYDNSPMESFWGTMQIELLDRQKWTTNVELSVAIADYIVNFYNKERRHSSLKYLTPQEFEVLSS